MVNYFQRRYQKSGKLHYSWESCQQHFWFNAESIFIWKFKWIDKNTLRFSFASLLSLRKNFVCFSRGTNLYSNIIFNKVLQSQRFSSCKLESKQSGMNIVLQFLRNYLFTQVASQARELGSMTFVLYLLSRAVKCV